MRPPEDRYCHKCGAEPGQACRTPAGNRTTIHKDRRNNTSHRDDVWKGTRLGCWKQGWNAGAGGMDNKAATKLAMSYLSPHDFLDGWMEGSHMRAKAHETARRRVYNG